MLEDIVMEKKTSRAVQSLGKGIATDPKKPQDGGSAKTFPRTSRRREGAGTSAPKHDPLRKSASQKGKTTDKRPRPRGPYMGGRKEGAEVADGEAEYGSLTSPGSKKQNLNHLLNFHYAPRTGASQLWRNHISFNHDSGGLSRYFRGTPHKYNKEQYLQANCQFVVKATADYRQYLYNPDQLVDWGLVEQIRVLSSEEFSCPICLYPPSAAKMTRCGHIYCWSCILHYLALSDKSWRKCPICYEAVHKNDLRSVKIFERTPFTLGADITMRLMKRERGSLEAIPVEQWQQRPNVTMLSVSETAVDTMYTKLLLANDEEVLGIVAKEKLELETQLKSNADSPEICFVQQALEILTQREASVKINKIPDESSKLEDKLSSHDLQFTSPIVSVINNDNKSECEEKGDIAGGLDSEDSTPFVPNRCRIESESSDDCTSNIKPEDIEHNTSQLPQKYFYFYQAADGQHIYLHALNARMLEMGYGSLEACPLTIAGRIVEKETGSMTDELRRRLRYLQHLPVTCQFEVAEIALKPPIISQEIVDVFKEQVDARRRRRQKRAREEWRREKKINEEENKKWGRHPTPHIHIASHHHFPTCGTDSSPPMGALPKSPSESSLSTQSPSSLSLENLILDPPPEEGPREEFPPVGLQAVSVHDSYGPSFAQMLRSGNTTFKSGGGAWGRSGGKITEARSMLSVPPNRQRTTSDSDAELEGYLPAPTYNQSFSDALTLALAKANSSAPSSDASADATACGKRKKKKQKPKVLFTTSMACSGK